MISVTHLTYSVQGRFLFNDVTCTFTANNRVGVVGRNGAGKSTFLKILARHLTPDKGTVHIDKGRKIAYLAQEIVQNSSKTVFEEACEEFSEQFLKEERKIALEELCNTGEATSQDVEEYGELLAECALFDKEEALERARTILVGLGFSQERMNMLVDQLSVGWRMRVVLARLLLKQADFYLFDEPTNHLDIVSKEWFADFLRTAPFGFLLVTHDTHYLNKVCDSTLEVERGNVTVYDGNFSFYCTEKEHRRQLVEQAYRTQQKERERMKETMHRFRAGSPSKHNVYHAMKKKLEEMELIEIEPTLPKVNFSFPGTQRAGEVVLTVDNLSHAFNNVSLFSNVNFQLKRQERIAIVAANGVGKTTLLSIIMNKLPLQQGVVTFGYNVKTAFFEQDQARVLIPSHTILEEVEQALPGVATAIVRSFLGAFLFPGDDVHKKIQVLSGGERNRVAMVKVLLQAANFLVLDEPTNHLDIQSKEVLAQALTQYQGSMLFVSHDHDFTQRLATSILELTPQGARLYEGDFESYLWQKQQEKGVSQPTPSISRSNTSSFKKSPSKSEEVKKEKKRSVEAILERMSMVEQLLEKEGLCLAKLSYGSSEYTACNKRIGDLRKELALLHEEGEAFDK